MYPALFGCCSMQVICPNCTLLKAPKGTGHNNVVVGEADFQFAVHHTDYGQLLSENNICYNHEGDHELPADDNCVEYLPRLHYVHLIHHEPVVVNNIAAITPIGSTTEF